MTYLRIPAKTLPRRWSWNPGQRDLHRASQQAAAGGLRLLATRCWRRHAADSGHQKQRVVADGWAVAEPSRSQSERWKGLHTVAPCCTRRGSWSCVVVDWGRCRHRRQKHRTWRDGSNALGSYEWTLSSGQIPGGILPRSSAKGRGWFDARAFCSQSGPLRRCWGWNPLFLFSHWIPFVNPESTGNVFYFDYFCGPWANPRLSNCCCPLNPPGICQWQMMARQHCILHRARAMSTLSECCLKPRRTRIKQQLMGWERPYILQLKMVT